MVVALVRHMIRYPSSSSVTMGTKRWEEALSFMLKRACWEAATNHSRCRRSWGFAAAAWGRWRRTWHGHALRRPCPSHSCKPRGTETVSPILMPAVRGASIPLPRQHAFRLNSCSQCHSFITLASFFFSLFTLPLFTFIRTVTSFIMLKIMRQFLAVSFFSCS